MSAEMVDLTRKKSPFYPRLEAIDIHHTWHSWQGYRSPDTLVDGDLEYFAVRNSAGVFDVSPMTKYRISGTDARVYIDRLVTRDMMNKVGPGRVAYAVWCDDSGQVIDDGTIFHLEEGVYRLCSQEFHLPWLQAAAIGFDVEIQEETAAVAGLALQGPTSYTILKNMGLEGIESLKMFGLMNFDFDGANLMVSRTGFTGDLGYELWIESARALDLWDALFAAGKLHGIRAIGTHALEQARIEAGYLAPFVDFLPATTTVRTGRTRSPFELGLDWLVDFKKPNFNGRRALAEEKRNGSTWRLVKLDIEGNKIAESSYIYADKKLKKNIGFVTSASWSPVCKKNIALGSVKAPHGKVGSTIYVEIYYQREMHWSRMIAAAEVVGKPFWDPPRRRATPPEPF